QLAMRRMVRQILHEPTIRARQAAANGTLDEYEAALETIFGLDVAETTEQRRRNDRAKTEETPAHDAVPAQQRTARLGFASARRPLRTTSPKRNAQHVEYHHVTNPPAARQTPRTTHRCRDGR